MKLHFSHRLTLKTLRLCYIIGRKNRNISGVGSKCSEVFSGVSIKAEIHLNSPHTRTQNLIENRLTEHSPCFEQKAILGQQLKICFISF